MNFENPERKQPNNEKFEQSFAWKSERATVEMAQTMAKEKLMELGWQEDSAEEFSLAVNEAVANAILHGNLKVNKADGESDFFERVSAAEAAEENKDKLVEVTFNFTKDEAVAEIKDEGDFMPAKPPEIGAPAGTLEGSGRGLGLIWNLTNDVEVAPGKITIRSNRRDREDKI